MESKQQLSDRSLALIKNTYLAPALQEVEKPQPEVGEVLLEVVCVGLCRTDLLIARGDIEVEKDSLILGHEFCGVVADSNGACSVPVGELVCVDPTFERSDGSDGFIGRDQNGCLSRWIAVPKDKIFSCGKMNAPIAAYLEPVAAAMGGVEAAVDIARSGKLGLLLGNNRIATLTSFLLQDAGLAFEQLDFEQFKEKAEVCLNNETSLYQWILETRLETDFFRLAAELLQSKGSVILKSRHSKTAQFPAMRWAEKQLSIVGRSRSEFNHALEWLKNNQQRIEPLLGPAYRMQQWQDAFSDANGGESGKVFIVPSGSEEKFIRFGGRLKG